MKKYIVATVFALLVAMSAQATDVSAGIEELNSVWLEPSNTTGILNVSPESINRIQQLTSNPGPGQWIQYRINLTINVNGSAGNISQINYTLPDRAVDYNVTNITITNSTWNWTNVTIGTGLGPITSNRTFVNSAGNVTVVFDFDANYTQIMGPGHKSGLFISFYLKPMMPPAHKTNSLSGSTYTDTWNFSHQGTHVGVGNASVVITPVNFDRRNGAVSAVSIYGVARGFTANTTHMTIYADLNGSTDASISWNGPSESRKSGSSASSGSTTTPTSPGALPNPLVMMVMMVIILGAVGAIVMVYMFKK